MIGRDNLLTKEIYPRLKNKRPFYLVGQRGIGKTAILKWAHEQCQDKKLYIGCGETYGPIVKAIAAVQGQDAISKKTITEIEKELLTLEPITLFLDEIEKATPKLIRLLKALNEFWPINMAGIQPFRDELKPLLWGKTELRINPLDNKYRRELAEFCIKETGSLTDASTMIQMSRGVPARCWAIARGEPLKNDYERVDGEEINIAPLLFLGLVLVMLARYIGRATDDKTLYLISSIIMGLSVLYRMMVYTLSKKS